MVYSGTRFACHENQPQLNNVDKLLIKAILDLLLPWNTSPF
jgi:hypothetical protein